jgi:hypothetical protein
MLDGAAPVGAAGEGLEVDGVPDAGLHGLDRLEADVGLQKRAREVVHHAVALAIHASAPTRFSPSCASTFSIGGGDGDGDGRVGRFSDPIDPPAPNEPHVRTSSPSAVSRATIALFQMDGSEQHNTTIHEIYILWLLRSV